MRWEVLLTLDIVYVDFGCQLFVYLNLIINNKLDHQSTYSNLMPE